MGMASECNTKGFGFWAAWVGIAADSSWLKMGLDEGKMYHSLTSTWIFLSGGKIPAEDRSITASLDASEFGTKGRVWNDTVHHRSSLLEVVLMGLCVEHNSPD